MDRRHRDMIEKRAGDAQGRFAIALALIDVAEAQQDVAGALQRLGNGNASTHYGAIEGLAMQVGDVAKSIDSLACGVADIALRIPAAD